MSDVRIYTTHYASPLGGITIASDGAALTGLWFDGQKYFGDTLPEQYVAGELPVFDDASPFRRAVWEILLTIPFGQTMTYGEIADKIAEQKGTDRMSAQAVGGAVGHNPISIIVPCHRVVGTSGSLTGYAGGIDKKVKLLTLEKTEMSGFFIPKKGTAL